MAPYWRRWWIDGAVSWCCYIALYAIVGTQPLGKAVLIGIVVTVARQSYHWAESAR